MNHKIHTSTLSIINNSLNRDEKIIWSEVPGSSSLQKFSIFFCVFSIPFTAFSIFWIYMASSITAKSPLAITAIFPLFGIPFVIVGFLALTSPIWATFARKKSACIITNQRAIVVNNRVINYSIHSYDLKNLNITRKIVNGNGNGDLIFEENFILPYSPIPKKIGFFGIKNINEIEKQLKPMG